jgi:hypothetical protein
MRLSADSVTAGVLSLCGDALLSLRRQLESPTPRVSRLRNDSRLEAATRDGRLVVAPLSHPTQHAPGAGN